MANVTMIPGQKLTANASFNYQGPAGTLTMAFHLLNGSQEVLYKFTSITATEAYLSPVGGGGSVTFEGSETRGLGNTTYTARVRIYYGTGSTAILLAEATGTVLVSAPAPSITGLTVTSLTTS